MSAGSTHWLAIVGSMAWFAFFVLLIFRPLLVWEHPLLAVLFFGGLGWWGAKARRTRRRGKKGLMDPTDSP